MTRGGVGHHGAWLAAIATVLIAAATFFWPFLALVCRLVEQGIGPSGGLSVTLRQLELLFDTLLLVGMSTLTALLLSVLVAWSLGPTTIGGRGTWMTALPVGVLVCTPAVLAFGWDLLWPGWIDEHIRCGLTWALWGWPIPLLMIRAGWNRGGQRLYEESILLTNSSRAWWISARGSMFRYLGLSGILLLVVFINDYGVPHAYGLRVFATELLGWASSSPRIADTLWTGWPLLVAVAALASTGAFLARRCLMDSRGPTAVANDEVSLRVLAILVVGSAAAPMVSLTWTYGSREDFLTAWTTFGRDLAWSCLAAGSAALLTVLLGVLSLAAPWGRRVLGCASLTFGVLPGPVVGLALIAAYNRPILGLIYDSWWIVMLSHSARYVWVGVGVAVFLFGGRRREEWEQADVDGTSRTAKAVHLFFRGDLPAWGAVMVVVTTLALGEIPSVSLVRVPSFAPVSLVMIEAFHRFEFGVLLAVSLWLVIPSVGAATLVAMALRRRQG